MDKERERTEGLENLVALINDEVLALTELDGSLLDQDLEAARGGDEDVRDRSLKLLPILLDRDTTIKNFGLDGRHVLLEALELLANLEGELAGVAEDEGLNRLVVLLRVELLESRQDEDSRLTHTGLGLAENVRSEVRTRDALVLN